LWHFIGECNYTTFDQVTPEVISSHFLGEHPSLKSVGEYTVTEERKVFRSLVYVMALDKTSHCLLSPQSLLNPFKFQKNVGGNNQFRRPGSSARLSETEI
jgi:hypothetical protein